MRHSLEYNQHQKIQVKSLNVLRIAAIMRLLCKGYTFRNEYLRVEDKILRAKVDPFEILVTGKGDIMNVNHPTRRSVIQMLAGAPTALGVMASIASAAGHTSKTPKILMPVGDATEAVDTLYPFFRVAEGGYRAVVAGPDARMYHMVLHEIPPASNIPWDITEERPGYHIKAEVAFRDVDPSEYAGLFVSGGRAPEYLRYDKDLMRITRHFFDANKPVAVVCHGIEIVSAAGVIRGRTVTTVAKCALDCMQGGGKYVDQPVVVDGNLVTARTWHDNTPFMREFMKMLASAREK